MKIAFVFFLALGLVVAGCSNGVELTRDEKSPEDDATIYFYLRDGSCIMSKSGKHPRVDAGYQVTGEIFSQDQSADMFWTVPSRRRFSGIVRDTDIRLITEKQLDVPVGAAVMALTIGAIMRSGRDEGACSEASRELSDGMYP